MRDTGSRKSFARRAGIFAMLGAVVAVLAVVAWIGGSEPAERIPLRVASVLPFHPDHCAEPPASAAWELQLMAQPLPVALLVQSGETLGQLFTELGLGASEAREASIELARHVEPRKVKAGSMYTAYFDSARQLTDFELAIDNKGKVHIGRDVTGWRSNWRPYIRTVETSVGSGELATSLEGAISQAGAPPVLAYQMADVLQWDLDFTRDLRVGDQFHVLYERVYLDGDYSSLGDILALRYENRGQILEAYRFGEDDSYYDAEGRPLKKMFLRSPLKFSRITSRFSRKRFHPVLKRYRPHYGVDYGAPTGTPVRVTSNGTVRFVGWNKGGGKTVKVRHPGGYESNYLHLSKFAPGISSGRSVRQGEVIGFVGSTGLSTGPHLDYRVKRNGTWIDPLTIKSVPARALSAGERGQFLRMRDNLRAKLSETSVPLAWPDVAAGEQLADYPSSEIDSELPDTSTATAGSR